eukprot:Skav234654  [mRNA]  locus=scaffold1131:184379:189731:- [translate_table: standard]
MRLCLFISPSTYPVHLTEWLRETSDTLGLRHAERHLLAAGASGSEPRQRKALEGVAFDRYLDDLKQLNFTTSRITEEEPLSAPATMQMNRILAAGLSQRLNAAPSEEAIVEALLLGYRLIDTAQAYENEALPHWLPGAEVGKAWQLSKLSREDIFIATKLSDDRSCKRRKAKAGAGAPAAEKVEDDVHRSVTSGDTACLTAARSWQDLEELYDEGILRSLGVSNFNYDDLPLGSLGQCALRLAAEVKPFFLLLAGLRLRVYWFEMAIWMFFTGNIEEIRGIIKPSGMRCLASFLGGRQKEGSYPNYHAESRVQLSYASAMRVKHFQSL